MNQVARNPKHDPRQEIFAREYADHRNGPLAKRRAGYSDGYNHFDLLRKPYVASRIRELWGHAIDEAGITAADVLNEIRRCAFQDIRDVFNAEGDLIPIHLLNDDVAATIASIDSEVRWEGRGDDAAPVVTKKIRRVDKMAALGLLAKHFKLVGDEGEGLNALASALADRLRAGRERASTLPADIVDVVDVRATPSTTTAPIIEPAAVEVRREPPPPPAPQQALARPRIVDSQPADEDEDEIWK